MVRKLLGLTVVLAGVSLLISCAPAPHHMVGPSAVIPEGELVGRVITAKIDLPLYRGMLVYANGEIDFGVYRSKLEVFGPSIMRYERGRITKVEQDSNRIEISLNKGGNVRGWGPAGIPRWKTRGQLNAEGALLLIDYGRLITSEDMKPERVAYALRDVLEIEGIGVTSAPEDRTASVTPAVLASIKLLSVEARPSRVAPGQTLDLAVHFEVEGASTENPLGLIISRQIYEDEKPLFSSPRTQQGHWAAGIHSAHFSMTVPANTRPGFYRFKATVSHSGEEEWREALFEVLEGGR
jgi:hypothetical protein